MGTVKVRLHFVRKLNPFIGHEVP